MFSKLSKPRQRSKRFFSKNLSVLRLFNKIIEYSIKRKYGHSSSFGLMASLNKLYDEIENFRILRLNCTGRSFFFRRRVQIELNEPVGKKNSFFGFRKIRKREGWFELVEVEVDQDSCQRCSVQTGLSRSVIGWKHARGLLFWLLMNFLRSDLNLSFAVVILIILNLCDENIPRSGLQFGRISIILPCDVLMGELKAAATTWSSQI